MNVFRKLLLSALTIVVFSAGTIRAEKPKVKGYYIDKAGEKVEVTLLVYTVVFSDKVDVKGHQDGFNYVDKRGKKVKINHEQTEEYGFTYKGEEFVFHFVPKKQGLSVLGPFYKGQFCRLIIDGPCQLYSILLARQGSNGSSTLDKEFVLWKNKGDLYLTRSGIRKLSVVPNAMSLEKLFADCPDLVARIENDEFKKGDDKYIRLVNAYNSDCQGKNGTSEEDSGESSEE